MASTQIAGSDVLQTRLSNYRETTLAGLLAAVPDREPRRYLYDPLSAHLSRLGKSIRPARCIATCQPFRGAAAAPTQSAPALEKPNHAIIVHADRDDETEPRTRQP